MLAPRKKLWTTPKEALLEGLEVLNIGKEDIVYDIGCGDGVFLLLCLDYLQKHYFDGAKEEDISQIHTRIIGVDIEQERIQLITEKIEDLSKNNSYHPEIFSHIEVIQANALDLQYSNGTCFYLYLIARGLEKIIQILIQNIKHPFRVVTFMYKIPNLKYQHVFKVHSEKHEYSQWPLYYYEINPLEVQFEGAETAVIRDDLTQTEVVEP
jgi:ubiquinone/menaquinone biosynthesis C-methylase UbiE